ncbi:MAG: DUF839 domain-containing protein [Gammaproteobacteria bacterium]|nr:DUF839 domain-containing protein [Gammaproteobacteria bacterium]
MSDRSASRAEYLESLEDRSVNPSTEATLGDLINRRFSRRDLLKGVLGVSALGALAASPLAALARSSVEVPVGSGSAASRFAFDEIAHGVDADHHVAPGYRADILIRWGDRVMADSPAFDVRAQTAAAQNRQFGYNNDFVGWVSLPFGSDNGTAGADLYGWVLLERTAVNQMTIYEWAYEDSGAQILAGAGGLYGFGAEGTSVAEPAVIVLLAAGGVAAARLRARRRSR